MKKILSIITLLFIISCTDNIDNANVTDSYTSKSSDSFRLENNLKSEMTLLVSRVLNSKNARYEVANFVQTVDSIYWTASISALLKDNANLSYVENANIAHLNTNLDNLLPNGYFKNNLLYEIKQAGIADYPTLIGDLVINRVTDEEIIDNLISFDLSIFLPDLYLHDWSTVLFRS